MPWYIQIRTTVHPPAQPGHPETVTFRQVAYPDEQGIGEGHVLCVHEHGTPWQALHCPEAQSLLCELRGHASGCPHDEEATVLALAQKGYAAYSNILRFSSRTPHTLQTFTELPHDEQVAWLAAVATIREET